MSPVDQDQYFALPSFEEKLQDQPGSCTFRPAHKALSSISCPISAHPSSAKAQHHGDQEVRHAHFPYDDVHGHDRDLLRSPAPPKSTTTNDVSSKWMTSRMRLMRTLKNPDGVMVRNKGSNHPVGDGYRLNGGSSSNNDTATRVCADCSTTKTPLWRGGPQGPKSLCNACGIRRRKAAAAMNGGISTANKEASSVNATDKGRAPDDGGECGAVPIKKRRRLVPSSGADQEKLRREEEEEFGVGLSWNSEEKEAAILLMALSSDMIFGRVW